MEPNSELQSEVVKAELQKIMREFNLDQSTLLALVNELPKSPQAPLHSPVAAETMVNTPNIELSKSLAENKEEMFPISLVNQLAEQLRTNRSPTALSQLEQQLHKTGLKDLGDTIADWVIWLDDKTNQLAELSESKAADKMKFWHRTIDYYLAADPNTSFREVLSDDEFSTMTLRILDSLINALRDRQHFLESVLGSKGITRIEAVPKSRRIAGVVEGSNVDTVPTDNPDLDGLVAYVAPGEGGFRYQNRVLVTTYARLYEYQPNEHL